MKIVLSSNAALRHHAVKLASLMRQHAPHHNYHTSTQRSADVWHLLSPYLCAELMLYASRTVVTMPNLHFIQYPHLFTPLQRYVLHPLLKESVRSAATIITHSPVTKQSIVSELEVEPSRVVVSPPIISHLTSLSEKWATPEGDRHISDEELQHVRREYELPQSFLLVMGDLDTRHGQASLITTIVERGIPIDLVMVSRHTSHADEILAYARRQKIATRIHILYEVNKREIKALYSLALGVIYTPPEGASIEPVVEGLKSGSAMLLSFTHANCETARGAAIYLDSLSSDDIAIALRSMLFDLSYRGQLSMQSRAESVRFSEESVAAELSSIYDKV